MITLFVGLALISGMGVLRYMETLRWRPALSVQAATLAVFFLALVGYSYHQAPSYRKVEYTFLSASTPGEVESMPVMYLADYYIVYVHSDRGLTKKALPVAATTIVYEYKSDPQVETFSALTVDDPEKTKGIPLWYLRLKRGPRIEFSHYRLTLPPGVTIKHG